VSDGESGFVALELSDEVPVELWEEGLSFGELLGSIFAAGLVELSECVDGLEWGIFCDGDELDVGGVSV
jgi:hypothetical protein